MAISNEELVAAVVQAAVDGRLTCVKAHELGKKLEVPLKRIGEICDELKIRIKDCALGCF